MALFELLDVYLMRAEFEAELGWPDFKAFYLFFFAWLLPGWIAGPVGTKQIWWGLCFGEIIDR